MGGKKKKGLGNKLAKMSEDERARYLQHRADIEEEARRKKEQLINMYFKNKIKKEEAFAKLNLAKINQHWHHLLRKTKCMEMKSNIHEMRQSIQRLVAAKNASIETLLEELDHAEFQYSFNFQTHLTSIDKMIEFHRNSIKQLSEEYDKDKCLVLENAEIEREEIEKFSENEVKYFKTLIFGHQATADEEMKGLNEIFKQKLDEHNIETSLEMEAMKKQCLKELNFLWKEITTTLQDYVTYTDQNRAHYAQLLSLDKRNQTEILKNNATIQAMQQEIEALKKLDKSNRAEFDLQRTMLENQQIEVKQEMHKARKDLQHNLKQSDDDLQNLTHISNETITHLERVCEKGEEILCLSKICEKYQNENDKKLLLINAACENDDEELLNHFATEGYQWLDGLENLWTLYNQAVADCEAGKSENRLLCKEKQELIETLKNKMEDER